MNFLLLWQLKSQIHSLALSIVHSSLYLLLVQTLYHIGRYLMLLQAFFRSLEKPSIYWHRFLDECISIGVGSLLIVALISSFLGAVATVQTAFQLTSGLIPKSIIGSIVVATTFLEIAPTVISLVLAGKVGSNIASELGTMRVTEQIDALEVMGINSAAYLIMPKIVSSMIMVPLLVIVSAFLQIFGGVVAGHLSGAVTSADFILGAREYFDPYQLTFMLTKAVTFGFIISSISAYQGYYTHGGALEVGQSSTRAVVYSCIIVLLADYVLANLLILNG